MSNLESMGLASGGKVEVEVYFTIEVAVVGKGSGYSTTIEVSPNETMDVLRSKVSFLKIFMQRRYQIYSVELDRVFEASTLPTIFFRDSGLTNGAKLQIREPSKRHVVDKGQPQETE